MTSTPLSVEFTIAGFFFFLSYFFIVLKPIGVKDLSFISSFTDYILIITIFIVGFSYFLGLLFNRLILSLVPSFSIFIRKSFRVRNSSIVCDNSTASSYKNIIYIWQFGSERLHKSLDFHNSDLTLFRLLALGFPMFGISFSYWLSSTNLSSYIWITLALSVILGIVSHFVYKKQLKYYLELSNFASEELKKLTRKV